MQKPVEQFITRLYVQLSVFNFFSVMRLGVPY
jgi:hypothetical protein